MKIIFIGQKGIPAKFGGVETHVEELATRLAKRGNEVFVYARKNYNKENLTEYKGVGLINLPSIPTKHLDAISHTLFACFNLMFRRVDIIHFHSIGPSFLIWLVRILKPRTKVVATFHTMCYHHKKWGGFARFALQMGEKVICTMPHRTITISKSLTKYAEEKYKKRVDYIPNGASTVNLEELPESNEWGLKKGEYILCVSRLVRHKGLHYLIEAFKRLDTNKKLVIVGGGAYTDSYVDELKGMSDGDDSIIFTGTQSGKKLNQLLSNAYLFVQPSESEGLSIALLEAMAYALPVLTSDIPENVEAVNGAGITFVNKNVFDLYDKLVFAENNADYLKHLSQKALRRVEKVYNWDNITDSVVNLYNDILKKDNDIILETELFHKIG